MGSMGTILSTHHIVDIAYWTVFFFGTCVWLLVCAGAAFRSKHNPLASRWEYVRMNWDIFLGRQIPDLILFMIWQHVSINDILAAAHVPWTWPGSSGGGLVGTLAVGFFADVLVTQGSKSKYVPDWLRAVIVERIPELPNGLEKAPSAPGE